ncbi:MAG: TIGR03668 family PPOX class F420-dependent oxidoreductase [Chloroflexi bacterium]|nr:TIGR03668 family PPOX class F420-dependent oxidoreductase [Chloroflexota bacterium]
MAGLSAEQSRFIDSLIVARLATVDEGGQPHVVPICFARDRDYIFTAIDRKPKRTVNLKRLKNITATARAAVLFDRYSDDWSSLAWVQIRGAAEILFAGPEHDYALQLLRGKYVQYRGVDLSAAPVIRIAAHHVATWGNLN